MKIILLSAVISLITLPLLADSWPSVDQYVPVRQKAFCNLMNQYETKAQNAEESRNQIRQNEVEEARGQDLLALIPDGQFENWLVEVRNVIVVPNGDAAYEMRLQCGVSIGSGKTATGQKYAATAKKDSLIYSQLAGVSAGDFILVNGSLIQFKDLNANDGRLAFASLIRGKAVVKKYRYNHRVKYYADITLLAKFTSK